MRTGQEPETLETLRAQWHGELLEVREAAKALLDLVTPRESDYFVGRGRHESLQLMTARLRLRAAIARSEG